MYVYILLKKTITCLPGELTYHLTKRTRPWAFETPFYGQGQMLSALAAISLRSSAVGAGEASK